MTGKYFTMKSFNCCKYAVGCSSVRIIPELGTAARLVVSICVAPLPPVQAVVSVS